MLFENGDRVLRCQGGIDKAPNLPFATKHLILFKEIIH